MKTIAAAVLALALFFLLGSFLIGAGGGGSPSGLRGRVLIDPGYPVCKTGASCGRPAAHAVLTFWRHGHAVSHTRTDGKGRFRIGLRPRRYRVTSLRGPRIRPARVTVPTDRYRRVTFRVDIGIR